MDAATAAKALSTACAHLTFGRPVSWTYDPLQYAWDGHRQYIERFGAAPKRVVMVGMNPGPWGMGQTGVPFGDPTVVREQMGITGIVVTQPPNVRENRPVHGLDAPRGEVSGARLYGALTTAFGTLPRAFEHLFIANYCPLLFFDEASRNLTPDKLRKADREALFAVCDRHVGQLIDHFTPTHLVGIGKFAEARATAVADATGFKGEVLGLLHPSPASPLANKEGGAYWRRQLLDVLARTGLPVQGSSGSADYDDA